MRLINIYALLALSRELLHLNKSYSLLRVNAFKFISIAISLQFLSQELILRVSLSLVTFRHLEFKYNFIQKSDESDMNIS